MKKFTALYLALDASTSTSAKVETLRRYFASGESADLALALFFLSGRSLKRIVPLDKLRRLAMALSGISEWLFQECYDNVGDLAETIALLLPDASERSNYSLSQMVALAETLRALSDLERDEKLTSIWSGLNRDEKFVFNKIITGGFRVGVSQQIVLRALSAVSNVPVNELAHRLMGDFRPDAASFEKLLSAASEIDLSSPYPFFLAQSLTASPDGSLRDLGAPGNFLFEWKWDGIRAQIVKRGGQVFLWSRGEELITERFPEISTAACLLPDHTVLDGEILAFAEGDVLPFALLQKRITRKSVGKKLLSEVPCVFMAFDLLQSGVDLREEPLSIRREKLAVLLSPGSLSQFPSCQGALSSVLRLPPLMEITDWSEAETLRAMSRSLKVEGLMIKEKQSAYGVGRKRHWLKWKVDPLSIDAVLVYAQRGHGRRASLYTDYTFALWHEEKLVPVAKAYSGLSDSEIRQVDAYVKENTLEKFGPVRTVKPGLVFEIAFEGIQASSRHKSGVAVRFPRIARWRTDKNIEDANSLNDLRALAKAL